MKRVLFIILFAVLAIHLYAQPMKRRALINTTIKPGIAEKEGHLQLLADAIIGQLRNELAKEFPCLSVTATSDLAAAILHDRQRVLLTGEDGNLRDIAQSMGVDYLISIEIAATSDVISFSASFSHANKAVARTKYSQTSRGYGENNLDDVASFCKALVKAMTENEICPYLGDISISLYSKLHETKSASHTASDNSSSSSYSSSTLIETKEDWTLKKLTWSGANGTINYSAVDEKKYNSQSRGRCLKYEDGAWLDIFQGSGNSSEHYEKSHKVKIVALDSVDAVEKKYPAAIKITFDVSKGIYWINVKAVSAPGNVFKKEYHQVNFSCPGPPVETIDRSGISHHMEVSIDRMFGPFKGKPSDKELKGELKQEFPSKNAISTETITFHFKR